jgi:hypothetical protein
VEEPRRDEFPNNYVDDLVHTERGWVVPHVHHCVDDDERQALQAKGLDPDDPAVIAAIDLVRKELSPGI